MPKIRPSLYLGTPCCSIIIINEREKRKIELEVRASAKHSFIIANNYFHTENKWTTGRTKSQYIYNTYTYRSTRAMIALDTTYE